ncbi:30S ribosomal protein S8 [Candidatus Roizmanbacteria bacterium RIFCSPHIGHO2_12_FULL_33_9]|uniref:Small ribosomal subunit protein uS8 n=1 Tax=Candidatus Roizmanbacteria bacterium RIFCSPHIGHO2_12_FULL_33_9 TaxID=1802045 RepID=A0A1F7HK27_9BACT|nr:MAG: 30S ribosomal protein S8 [Candidatus Roizmanbacteria bacterium RIFCSPHIGHO2_12_FULL_33_9]
MKGSYIDLLIRIKNGYMASKDSVMTPYSKIKEDILKILKKLGYIEDFVVDKKNKLDITVILAYENNKPLFTDVKIFSKPGRKFYIKSTEIKTDRSGITSKVLSTSKGVMTDIEAKKNKIGGELLFEIS